MKFALVFIALALFQVVSSQIPGGWQSTPWDSNNQELVDLLDWGVNEAVYEAVDAGELEAGEWSVSEVNGFWSQIVAGTNYEWDVDIDNGQGETHNLDLVVYEPLEGSPDLTSWHLNY